MQQDKAVGTVRLWEVIVALCFLVFGSVVSWDSHRLGSSWGSDGPQAGYFPFYIGIIIIVSAVINLYGALRMGADGRKAFVEWGQIRLILAVMLPSIVYVALIDNPWYALGIYVPSALFIAMYMRILGKYSWLMIAAVAIGVMLAFFVSFEVWFKVPLPKGPVEALFGFE
ncbi:MAG TPA: tripartite tricarboxylate transporter TctB family protein [Usitatibacter sp.]|nr:tripartite tricarboxylate transporter TctB family protein [Usitatibacter sp.]